MNVHKYTISICMLERGRVFVCHFIGSTDCERVCSANVSSKHDFLGLIFLNTHLQAPVKSRHASPQWGAADAEIKVPYDENTELNGSPFKAWSRSVYCLSLIHI